MHSRTRVIAGLKIYRVLNLFALVDVAFILRCNIIANRAQCCREIEVEVVVVVVESFIFMCFKVHMPVIHQRIVSLVDKEIRINTLV